MNGRIRMNTIHRPRVMKNSLVYKLNYVYNYILDSVLQHHNDVSVHLNSRSIESLLISLR